MSWERLCKVMHKYRAHQDPDNQCRFILICERNETHPRKEKFEHVLPSVWSMTKPCVYERHCACGEEKETKTEHQWPQQWAATDTPCYFVQQCLGGCDAAPLTTVEHLWSGEWHQTAHPCRSVRRCTRDGSHPVDEQWVHDWQDAWEYIHVAEAEERLVPKFAQGFVQSVHSAMDLMGHDCARKRYCKHHPTCRDGVQAGLTAHEWSEKLVDDALSCQRINECVNCRRKKIREPEWSEHLWIKQPQGGADKCSRCGKPDPSFRLSR